MESNSQQSAGYGLIFGFMAGTVVGAGLALWLTPGSASELRDRVTEQVVRNGNRVRDDVAESVVRGAHEVERFAVAAKSDTGKARG